MTRINIVVEGQTERQFVEGPLLEHLLPFGILVSGKIIGVPGHKGGRVNYARVKKDVTHLLRSDRRSHCSTLIDYYGLGDGFPGDASRQEKTLRQQHAAGIERATLDDIAEALGDDLRVRERFVPFIVLHEFEALLFSDPNALAESIGEPSLANDSRILSPRLALQRISTIVHKPHRPSGFSESFLDIARHWTGPVRLRRSASPRSFVLAHTSRNGSSGSKSLPVPVPDQTSSATPRSCTESGAFTVGSHLDSSCLMK